MENNLPPPHQLTEDDRKFIVDQAHQCGLEFGKKVAAIENLTAEDCSFLIR